MPKANSTQRNAYHALLAELAAAADPERARNLAWFFQTEPGGYGEGDRFLGIRVPMQRKIARRYDGDLSLTDVERLLASGIHEHRLTAACILVARYQRAAEPKEKTAIVRCYLNNAERFNNWDLVDASAPYILGAHLLTRARPPLYRLARSANIWKRRIAILSTFAFLRAGETADTFRLAEILLADHHDLIRKAVGWALREAGVTSRAELLRFLARNYALISRTTLRYAIEHFSPADRRCILAGEMTAVMPETLL